MSLLPLRSVFGQPSWSFRSTHVHAHLTRQGGHLGPVEFRLGQRTVAPFSVAPWAEEKLAADIPPLIRVLRGDFFCAPFGDGSTWRGETHPAHGESANANWKLEKVERSDQRLTLHASLATIARPGRIDKSITLVAHQTAIYQRHVLSANGPMCLGHHAMVKFPDRPGSGVISTSRFIRGQVFPERFGNPALGGRQSLKPGARFRSLTRVPLLTGGSTDLTCYPARPGFDDVVMLTADARLPFAWTAVTFPRERFVWFALRDPRVLRHTMMWISNGGVHHAPWNGRHTAVMGIEDVTSYFQYGLAKSVQPNPLSRRGIPTSLRLDSNQPTTIHYLMAVAAIPTGFDRVTEINAVKGGVELRAASGKRVQSAVELAFLRETPE